MVIASVVMADAKEKVLFGGTSPVFVANDEDEQQRVAMYMSRITGGVVHDLENGVLIVVRH